MRSFFIKDAYSALIRPFSVHIFLGIHHYDVKYSSKGKLILNGILLSFDHNFTISSVRLLKRPFSHLNRVILRLHVAFAMLC